MGVFIVHGNRPVFVCCWGSGHTIGCESLLSGYAGKARALEKADFKLSSLMGSLNNQ